MAFILDLMSAGKNMMLLHVLQHLIWNFLKNLFSQLTDRHTRCKCYKLDNVTSSNLPCKIQALLVRVQDTHVLEVGWTDADNDHRHWLMRSRHQSLLGRIHIIDRSIRNDQ